MRFVGFRTSDDCVVRAGRSGWLTLARFVTLAAALSGSSLPTASASNTGTPAPRLSTDAEFRVNRETALALGHRIWLNEGQANSDKLVWWNDGEEFASLGIAHFIWYPEGRTGPFRESFPALLRYLTEQGVSLPPWLERARLRGCPWPTRTAFLAARSKPALSELRGLLERTIALQAQYVAASLAPAYRRLLEHAPQPHGPMVEANFRQLAASEHGLYALIDYLNFKGDGTRIEERYRGQGWGLLQVLLAMSDAPSRDASASERFATAAERVLERRVANSPPERNESRWLAGWRKRLLSYYPNRHSSPLKTR